MENLEIVFTTDAEEIKKLIKNGYTPVECSQGNESIVDALEMDHHGNMSDKESVAIRAYRDFFGARAENPKFVVNHIDADNMFAVAALAGLLPHPDSAYAASLPPYLQAPWKKDLMPLAETIAVIDTDPIGRDMLSIPYGKELITWNSLYGNQSKTRLEALAAVQGWRTLLTNRSAEIFINAAEKSEAERVEMAHSDMEERGKRRGEVFAIYESRMFGFDVWYQRNVENGGPTDPQGWDHPLVMSLTEKDHNITFGSPNKEVAEKVLGKGGWKNVFAKLNELYECQEGAGFGGRETIGGSPRGQTFTAEDLAKVAVVVNQVAMAHQKSQEQAMLNANGGKTL